MLDRFGFISAVMEISIHSLFDGATRATGTVVVIDVFRAFTTAAVALANGACSIVMVRTVEEALALRDAGNGQICMGEVRGRAPDGFDFGNSPFEISGVDFSGKTIIQRTSAGTQGIVAANRAERLYAASLVTAEATVRALLSGSPDQAPWSQWVTMASSELTRTNYARSTCGTAWKADRAMQTPFVASSALAAKSGAFTSGAFIFASGGYRHRTRY
jgi:2-phosphosulfolactate phosphatase